jgi:hypothetical protein
VKPLEDSCALADAYYRAWITPEIEQRNQDLAAQLWVREAPAECILDRLTEDHVQRISSALLAKGVPPHEAAVPTREQISPPKEFIYEGKAVPEPDLLTYDGLRNKSIRDYMTEQNEWETLMSLYDMYVARAIEHGLLPDLQIPINMDEGLKYDYVGWGHWPEWLPRVLQAPELIRVIGDDEVYPPQEIYAALVRRLFKNVPPSDKDKQRAEYPFLCLPAEFGAATSFARYLHTAMYGLGTLLLPYRYMTLIQKPWDIDYTIVRTPSEKHPIRACLPPKSLAVTVESVDDAMSESDDAKPAGRREVC